MDEEERGYYPSKLGGIKGGGMGTTVIISIIAAVIVFLGMGMLGGGVFLTKADFEANLEGMVASVEEAKASANTAVQGIPTAITTAVNDAVSQWSTRINTNVTDIASLKATVASHTTAIATFALKTDLATYGKKADLDTAIKRIKVLEDKLATTTSGTGVGGVSQGVTISVDFAPANPVYATGDYTYFLTITNTSGVAKKVYLQATATPSGTTSGYTVATGTTKFYSTSGYLAPATFTTHCSSALNCLVINGISDGYLWMGTTAVQVPVTLHLEYSPATPVTMWNVIFTPIVTTP